MCVCLFVRDATVHVLFCRSVQYGPYGLIHTCEPRYYSTPVNSLSFSKRAGGAGDERGN